MFLEYCSEENKKVFLEIAYYLAKSDGNFSHDEKRLLELYKQEANLSNYEPRKLSAQQIMSEIASAPPVEQRVMALEALCMIRVDEKITGREIKSFNKLFSIPSDAINEDFVMGAEEIAKDILRINDIALAIIRRG